METLWESEGRNPNSNQPFFSVKRAEGYYVFGERAGIDSVAFILFDSEKGRIGLINEPKPPLGKDVFLTTAFGGSLDKDLTDLEIVQEEVKEEAGYTISLDDITYLGEVLVSTQMNQLCKLFAVDVTGIIQGQRQLEEHEARSTVVWFDNRKDILALNDWKAPLIILKYEDYVLEKRKYEN